MNIAKICGKLGLIFLIPLLLSGCNLFPEPVSLIKAPAQAKERSQIGNNYSQVIAPFLPQGTSLFTPNEPVGVSPILEADFDQDGVNEIVFFYKSSIKSDNTGAIILQKEENTWKQAGHVEGPGYDISWGSTTDITGDGKPELLIGFMMGASFGSILDIYSYQDKKFEKLTQLNYNELDLIYANDQYRIATWQRSFADVYDIEIWKWDNGSFVPDQELYESYFSTIASYYQERIKEVPDTAYYYYYLADAWLKAKQPQLAADIIRKGMSLNITVPSYDKFVELQEKIQVAQQNDVELYDSASNLTLSIPKELTNNITIEGQQGQNFEYKLNVNFTDSTTKTPLFTVEIYSKDFTLKEDLTFPLLTETDEHFYTIERKENLDGSNILFDQAASYLDEIIASIKIGPPFTKHRSVEEELLIKKVHDATMKKAYVNAGGAVESDTIQSFKVNELDYRYLGPDLDSFEKLFAYLSDSFTREAIQSYIESMKIIEHNGRLAQPNADGGSLLNYLKASIAKHQILETETQFDLKVPIGNSFAFEIIPISFMKTEDGWRISSNPITF
ncbi:DL-endopeptidase inhibitor IseA family protein [Robertmurraya andreesenii]|uniref:Lipoprotein n=1 Tax=Anoxybacillus andreesenii TaxID=1325932 RepID=A0ABT9UZD9_9BACL|nr:DL-endopeptidase inhibitor IseA family protein [Robertmurraya andreesenii]MDQ0154051.1 hypothetical protein [Robertmurraya andreesenii]